MKITVNFFNIVWTLLVLLFVCSDAKAQQPKFENAFSRTNQISPRLGFVCGGASGAQSMFVDSNMSVHGGRCPVLVNVEEEHEQPHRRESTNRCYFFRDSIACGPGLDHSVYLVNYESKFIRSQLNKTYLLYRPDDEKRERPVGTLEVKNGNGFIDKFKTGTLTEAESIYGKAIDNRVTANRRGAPPFVYSEPLTKVIDLDGIDQSGGHFSKFSIYMHVYSGKIIRYVVDGPGIICLDPKSDCLENVMQYVSYGADTFWIDLRPDVSLLKSQWSVIPPTDGFALSDGNAKLFALIDQRISANQGMSPIPFPYPYNESVTFGSSSQRKHRHQLKSPTMPDGTPIPDSR